MATLLQNQHVRALIEGDYLDAIAGLDDATTRLTLGLGASIAAAERGERLTSDQREELRQAAEHLRHRANLVAEVASVVVTSSQLPPAPAAGQRDRVVHSLTSTCQRQRRGER